MSTDASDLAHRVLKLEQDNGELKARVLVLENRILGDLDNIRASNNVTQTQMRRLERAVLGDGVTPGMVTRIDRVEQTNIQLRWVVSATLATALSTLGRLFFV